jgi:hypothetical protein
MVDYLLERTQCNVFHTLLCFLLSNAETAIVQTGQKMDSNQLLEMCDANQPAAKECYSNVQKYKEPKMDRAIFQRKLKNI